MNVFKVVYYFSYQGIAGFRGSMMLDIIVRGEQIKTVVYQLNIIHIHVLSLSKCVFCVVVL